MVYLWILRHTSKSDNSVISHCWNWRRSRQGNPKARQATDVKLTNLSHRLTLCKLMLLEKRVSYRKQKSSILKKKISVAHYWFLPSYSSKANAAGWEFPQRSLSCVPPWRVEITPGGSSIPFPSLCSAMSYASQAPRISPFTAKFSISVEWAIITLWSH